MQEPLVRGVKVRVFKTGDCDNPQAGPETFHETATVGVETLPPLAVTVNSDPAFPGLSPFEPVRVRAGAGVGLKVMFIGLD